ncbi:MAG: M23 family metallopeptidase, partial [Gammaproteobacteria bacterium]
KTSYYTPEGNNVRKAFLRSPVDFARISSHFNLQRKHPVLHTIRAHKGVDYAAKRGTPVKATGDGKVIFKGRKGGYGRVVILQHGQKYSTLYAHLQGFAKQISVGDRVRQSQVIGFIGSSGLATGPHLHYEFRVNNVHKNPLTVKFPNAAPVSKAYRASFEKTARTRLAQIDKLLQTTVARSADATSLPDG